MDNNNNLIILINENNWEEIYNQLENNLIDPNKEVINSNNIAHLAAITNNQNILEYLSQTNSPSILKKNKTGNNCLHLLAEYGFILTLKNLLTYNPDTINLINNNGDTVVHILNKQSDFLGWMIQNMDNIDTNIINNNNDSILTLCIDNCKQYGDPYFDLIEDIINYGCDLNIPKNNLPIIKCIEQNKLEILELIIDKCNVNILDSNNLSPLIIAVLNNNNSAVKLLLNQKININYSGPQGDQNPLMLAIKKQNNEIVSLLLNMSPDCKKIDRHMKTALHYALQNKINYDILAKLIWNSDVNFPDIKGETPLHLLIKTNKWKSFDKILINKPLDIFINDYKNKCALNFLPNNEYQNFIELITKSKYNELKDQIIMPYCSRSGFLSKKCKKYLREQIFKQQHANYNKFDKIFNYPYSNLGKFNSDILHNLIYTILLLKKYKNVGVPFQYFIGDKVINDQILLHNNAFKFQDQLIISDLVQIYHDYFYELLPYLILWKSESEYYIDSKLKFYIKKCLSSDKIRYVFFKLTLISSKTSTHANILIFDKLTGYLERFEPFGKVPYLDNQKLDLFLEQTFNEYLSNYLSDNNLKFYYFSPQHYIYDSSFQILSKEGDLLGKKMGDPPGYCLAWTFWYLEMRVNYPDLDPFNLMKFSINKIMMNQSAKKEYVFLEFIRNYANYLDNLKNNFLKQIGIDEKYYYDIVLPPKLQERVIKHLLIEFDSIVRERY